MSSSLSTHDTSSSSWEDSDFSSNHRYDDMEKRPTRKEADALCNALQRYGFEKLKYIARGSYGYVYKMGYRTHRKQSRPRVVAVKIMYAHKNKHLPDRVEIFHKAFNKVIRQRLAQHRRRHEDLDIDTGYFTEDRVYPHVPCTFKMSGRTKEYTLHFMEALSGVELYDYIHTKGRHLQLKNLMTLFCRLLHALHFFHDAGVMFNDMKLENLMIDPVTFHVSFIDFYDSNTQCTHTHCTEQPHIVYTFRDRFHEVGLHEDIWRMGLTILDIIEIIHRSRAHHYGRIRESDVYDTLPSDLVKKKCKYSDRYPKIYVDSVVKDVCQKASEMYANDRSYGLPAHTLFLQIQRSLMNMLHGHVRTRPSIVHLLQSLPWRICTYTKQSSKHQRCSYRPLQRLTPLQRSRKANVLDLDRVKRYIPDPVSSDYNDTSATLGEKWEDNVVSSSDFRTTTAKDARMYRTSRMSKTRKRASHTKVYASSDMSNPMTSASSMKLPRTHEAMRRRARARARKR